MNRNRFTPERVTELNEKFRSSSPQEILRFTLDELGDDVALASSFGIEDMTLIDMICKISPKARIFTLDTGRLHAETYTVMEQTRVKYDIQIHSYFPDREKIEKLERTKGFYSFRESIENRKECCGIRKVEPLNRALADLRGWITGLRREQSVTRADVDIFQIDEGHRGILKVNPLAYWTEQQTWDYVRENKVPYNRLHDIGFPSIGCEPCTRAVSPGEDIRAGRWWWESAETRECGLHTGEEGGSGI